jgi:outer membrane protein assembly factor BamB
MSTVNRTLAFLLLFYFFASPAGAGDWPKWLGPKGSGVADEALPAGFDPESVAWRASVGTGFSSVAVAGRMVFTLGHDGAKQGGKETIWALDAATGKVVWSASYEAALLPNLHEGGPAATPAVVENRVFTLSKDGQAHCHDAATGRLLWRRDLLAESGLKNPPEWGFAGSPLPMGKAIVFEAGSTMALDPKTGDLIWKSQPFRPAYGSPVFWEQQGIRRLAVLKTDGLVVLDADNGGTLAFERWETSFDTNATTPIVSGDSLFVSTGYDRGCALFHFDGRKFSKRYELPVMCNHMNQSVPLDGHLYGFDGTAHRGRPTEFVCIEVGSGKERWRVPPGEGLGCGSVIATADGRLVILSEKGEMVIARADPAAFKIEARAQILGGRCWTPPVLSGGRVFARNSRGDVVALGVPAAPGR